MPDQVRDHFHQPGHQQPQREQNEIQVRRHGNGKNKKKKGYALCRSQSRPQASPINA